MMLLLCCAVGGFAQQGEALHRAIAEDPLTVASGAALVAALAGAVPSDQPIDPDEAMAVLLALGYSLPSSGADSPLRYGDFALLVMQAFDLRGGLRHELLATTGSAFREFEKRSLLSSGVYIGTPISGAAALDILHHFLTAAER